MSLSEEQKTQWVRDNLGATIAKITLSGDRVEEVIVADALYDAVSEALQSMKLPASFPDQEGVAREQLEADFASYCKMVIIRAATTDQLAVPDDSLAPELLFMRPITTRMKFEGFMNQWDRSTRFTENLRAMGCPFDFSFEEKKLLFGMATLLNCMAMSAGQPKPPNPEDVNVFKM